MQDNLSHSNAKGSGNLISWFATNHVAANILMIFIIIAGLISVGQMVREVFPTVDPRTIVVKVAYPGATPQDVEEGITRRVEEALIGIQGIKRVDSQATEGFGVVTAELEDFVSENQVLNDVETEVDSINNFPPEEAEQVRVLLSKPTGPVMTLVVYGDLGESALRDWAESIEDEILQLPNVTLTSISGARDREISIEVSEQNLRKYQLTIEDVARQVSASSIDLPAGTLRSRGAEILIRINDKRYRAEDFSNIVIRSDVDGSLLTLGEIARLNDGFKSQELINTLNGQPAIFIDISRSTSQDTVEIQQEVKSYVTDLKLPEGVNLTIWKDQTDILKDRINLLGRNATLGLALVFLALVLFLDLKLAFWTSAGIAVSFTGGLLVASLFGITINMVSLFALIVVLGVVVDDAIVTGESIFSEQERGLKGMEATLSGVRRIVAPVTIGVLTTVAAFAPLLFSTGSLGQILRPVPIIVISILMFSLLEAFFILPAHLTGSKRWSVGLLAEMRSIVSGALDRFVENYLLPFSRKAIRFKYLTIAAIAAFVISAFLCLITGILPFIFFPQIESDELTISLEMPIGTAFSETEHAVNQILEAGVGVRNHYDSLAGFSDSKIGSSSIFKSMSVTIGGKRNSRNGPHGSDENTIASHIAQIEVQLVPSAKRSVGSSEIEREWQKAVGVIAGANKVAFESSLVRDGEDLNIQLAHRDTQTLEDASEDLKAQIKQIAGVYEVVDTSEPGKQEFVYRPNVAGEAAGLTPLDLGRQLRGLFFGSEVQRIQRGRQEIKVMVRYPESEIKNLAVMDRTQIQLPNGQRAALSDIADRERLRTPANIKRVDGRRVIQVTGDVDENVTTPSEVIDQIFSEIVPELIKQYPGLSTALEGKSKDQRKDLQVLAKNMLIALLLIFVMLASQLRSYVKPFIIIATVPLGIAGAVYGHLLLGYGLSFISLFGMVALSGVVINDSVVLVDYYNHLLSKGHEAREAVLLAVARRFRPILLTTLTTSLGLLPMLFETSLQARFLIPMAVSLACGILFASVLLIILVPCLLIVAADLQARFTGKTQPSSLDSPAGS